MYTVYTRLSRDPTGSLLSRRGWTKRNTCYTNDRLGRLRSLLARAQGVRDGVLVLAAGGGVLE